MRKPKGFTLIEMMVVVALIAIFAGLAIGMLAASGRARLNNAVFDASAALSTAQARARSLGRFDYVVFWEDGAGKFGEQTLETKFSIPTANWANYDPTNVAALKDINGNSAVLIGTLPLSESGGIVPYALASVAALPAPFTAVNKTAGGGSSTLSAACAFCAATGPGTVGAVEFSPDGRARMANAPAEVSGGAIAFAVSHTGETAQPKVIAITAPTGLAKVFSP